MIQQQQSMILSSYMELYDIIIPKDNLLRRIKELVDFSFIYDELVVNYCIDNGRNAINPVRMFKYLLLKSIYDLSDVDVVERSKYDMSYKYFLDMAPEDSVIESSSLTKFRKLRLKDMNILDMLIQKTVSIAIEKGLIKSNSIIVDSTHTRARYNQKSAKEILVERAKLLRKSVYQVDEKIKQKFPPKQVTNELEDEMAYCKQLVEIIEEENGLSEYPKIKEKLNRLKETLADDTEQLQSSKDEDAKVGHKTADSSFFGYKTHLAITEERIITAATITTGEKVDGKELKALVEKSIEAGIKVTNIIGDKAYSEKGNIEYATEKGIHLISKLSSNVTHGHRRKDDEFLFNKDADMYVCKAGHLAIGRRMNARTKIQGTQLRYMFDVEKCKKCSMKKGCYKEGAKTKAYTVAIKESIHNEQHDFQESEYFKEKAKERYKIEAKNSELKHRHGFDVSKSSGLFAMELQGAVTIFAVNMKRIIKLLG